MANDFESQLDIIRVQLYERTKSMANSEAVRVTNENAKKIAARYGIIIEKEPYASADKMPTSLSAKE